MTTERVLPPYRAGRGDGAVPPPAGVAEAGSTTAGTPAAPEKDAVRAEGVARRPRAATASASATGRSAMAGLARRRGDAYFSTATRAGILVGVSAAVYAASLATVARLEAQSQADAAAAVQPAVDALASTQAANDQLQAAIKDADGRLRALASEYNTASTDMTAVQAQFSELSALVAKIQGTAAAINTNFKLPTVTIRGAVGGGGGGTVVTTTTASGKP